MTYGDFKDLTEQLLIKCYMIKHFILPRIQNKRDINVKLPQWIINFLIKKTSGGRIENKIISNKELAEESQKPTI